MEKLEEYPITGKGVYIIINLDRHNFNGAWSGLEKLDYESDRKNLLSVFNLTDKPTNLLMARNLTKEAGEGGFDYFMDNLKSSLIKKDEDNDDPSFVVFVLMSHGTTNGGFLLSTPADAESRVEPCNCSSNNHEAGTDCYMRFITRDVLEKLCKAYPSPIPKIVIIQTCRGTTRSTVAVGEADCVIKGTECAAPSDDELCDLKFADCFLLQPCVESQGCWVSKDGTGSFLIGNFCYALRLLRYNAANLSKDADKLLAIKGSTDGSHPIDKLVNHISSESFLNGWLTNICQHTALLASNVLIKEKSALGETPYDKQQPHFSSSLAYKLSCLKILKTQWQDKDPYLAAWYDEMLKVEEESDEDN